MRVKNPTWRADFATWRVLGAHLEATWRVRLNCLKSLSNNSLERKSPQLGGDLGKSNYSAHIKNTVISVLRHLS
jgi:hypothetical protein